MTDFQDTFHPTSNSSGFRRAPASMTKSRLIDWGNKNIPLQGEAQSSLGCFALCRACCIPQRPASLHGAAWPRERRLQMERADKVPLSEASGALISARERQPDRGNHGFCPSRPRLPCTEAKHLSGLVRTAPAASGSWPKLVESSQTDFSHVQSSQCLGMLQSSQLRRRAEFKVVVLVRRQG